MKCRVSRTCSLQKILDYQFETAAPNSSVDPWNVVASNCSLSRAALLLEFKAVSMLRPDIERSYLHLVLSLQEREVLHRGAWSQVTRFVLETVGIDTRKHQYVARRHSQTKFDHTHTVVNRVAMDGTVWRGEFEAWKFIDACQHAERKFGLRPSVGLRYVRSNVDPAVRPRESDYEGAIRSNRGALRQFGRKQDLVEMSSRLGDCAAAALDFDDFQTRAEHFGIDVMQVEGHGSTYRGVVVREFWARDWLKLSSVTKRHLSHKKLQSAFADNLATFHANRGWHEELFGKRAGDAAIRLRRRRNERSKLLQDSAAMIEALRECVNSSLDLQDLVGRARDIGLDVKFSEGDTARDQCTLVRESWAEDWLNVTAATSGELTLAALEETFAENVVAYELQRPVDSDSEQEIGRIEDDPENDGASFVRRFDDETAGDSEPDEHGSGPRGRLYGQSESG
jgi:hypothetical protein